MFIFRLPLKILLINNLNKTIVTVMVSIILVSSIAFVYAIETPVVSIGLDHGFASQKDVADYMNNKNMTGSLFIITRQLSNPFFMNTTTLLHLQDTNWEIVSHTTNHTLLVGAEQSIIDFEVVESRGILENLGFEIYGFTPPFIALDEPAMTTVFDNYHWVGVRGGPTIDFEYDEPSDTYLVPSTEVGTGSVIFDFQSAKDMIDDAIINDKWLVMNVHQIDEDADNPFSFPLTEIQKIIDYLDETNVSVLPISEVLGLSCTPPFSGDWIISSNCVFNENTTANGNVIVQNNSRLTIPTGLTLGIDFDIYNLTIENGSSVLIKSGGSID